MKAILAATALVVLVAGCTGTSEERSSKRDVAVAIALDRIERFNAMGVDPLQLEDMQLLALDTACVAVLIGGVEFGLDEEVLKTVSAVCEVIMKAAAKAADVPMSEPEPKPDV